MISALPVHPRTAPLRLTRFIAEQRERLASVPIPIIILIMSLLWPTTFSVSLGVINVTPYRLALLVLFPVSISRLANLRRPFAYPDYFMIAFGIFQGLALFIHHGVFEPIAISVVGGGRMTTNSFVNVFGTFIDSLGTYCVARAYIDDEKKLVGVVRLIMMVAIALGIPTLYESVTGISLFGMPPAGATRFGLNRAAGPFPHPILWGLFASSTFAFVFSKDVVRLRALAGLTFAVCLVVAIGTSVSSAPIATVIIQLLLLIWFRVSSNLPNRNAYFIVGCIAGWFMIDLLSNRSPLQVIFTTTALDSWTGYYRTLIWQYGWAAFANSPFIGVGFNRIFMPSWMTSSVDSLWLMCLLLYGMLGTVPLALSIAGALIRAGKTDKFLHLQPLRLVHFWAACLASLIVGGFTVHYWAQLYIEFFLFIGMWGAFGPLIGAAAKTAVAATKTAHHPRLLGRKLQPRPDRTLRTRDM